MKNLNQYCNSYPAPQNSIELFNDWASSLPEIKGSLLKAGKSNLFNDERIHWANEQFGGFKGMKILELGPLEGGHTYMLEQMGADSILAIEANKQAYLKCLIVKELYKLNNCHFVLGDFVKFLRQTTETYDCCLASGVLYHMLNPVELISLIAKVSDKTLIWTHYYEEIAIKKMSILKRNKFSKGEDSEFAGFNCTRFKQRYGLGIKRRNFWGGMAPHSYWMKANDIISGLKYFGFKNVTINFNQTNHQNGPSFCLVCTKD